MVAGYPSDATDTAVQANIAAAGYATERHAVHARSADCRYRPPPPAAPPTTCSHDASDTKVVICAGELLQFRHRQGRRHLDRRARPGEQRLRLLRVGQRARPVPQALCIRALPSNATTEPRCSPPTPRSARNPATAAQATPSSPFNYPAKYIRHYSFVGYVASDGGSNAWDTTSMWAAGHQLARLRSLELTSSPPRVRCRRRTESAPDPGTSTQPTPSVQPGGRVPRRSPHTHP